MPSHRLIAVATFAGSTIEFTDFIDGSAATHHRSPRGATLRPALAEG